MEREKIKQGIADLLQNLREKHGYSKNHMAELLGINKRTWYAWESGETCPTVADFIAAFDACDEPITRPLLDMLHPDVYAGVTDQSDAAKVRKALAHYVTNAASDHAARICMYMLSGSHGSEIAAQIEEFCALEHLPIEYRYMVAEQIYLLYVMSERRGELKATDSVMPNMDTWKAALKEGQKAAYKRLNSYSSITGKGAE